ncbi:hypothetical protein RDI58_020555 [Solanum bulbocastanum]|uniref:F-box domain-containing protein n=1 Tax=Solanum bulbocastanum TaxID=147425 RepID=A0AAN8T7D4_SOLBU
MNMRSGGSSGADRISSLPCDFLQKILGCLPLHDAVRTSVLSTKWSEFDSFIIEAPNLKIFEFSDRENSLCFKRTPLLEEIVLGMPFNVLESFTVPEPQLTLVNIKILNFKNLIFTKVNWVTYVLDLINCCPNIERLLITHVLAYATALEKIYIVTSADNRHRGMKIMEEMKQFPASIS